MKKEEMNISAVATDYRATYLKKQECETSLKLTGEQLKRFAADNPGQFVRNTLSIAGTGIAVRRSEKRQQKLNQDLVTPKLVRQLLDSPAAEALTIGFNAALLPRGNEEVEALLAQCGYEEVRSVYYSVVVNSKL